MDQADETVVSELDDPTELPGLYDAQQLVARDVPCIRCGYNLRTLHRDAVCPECGQTVSRATFSRRLLFADARWLKALRRGLSLLVVGTILLAVTAVVWFILTKTRVGPFARRDAVSRDLLIWCLGIPPGLVGFVGLWWFTRPEPNPPQSLWLRVRGLVRALLLGVLIVALASGPVVLLSHGTGRSMVVLGALVLAAAGVLMLFYTDWLVRRLPDEKLRKQMKVMFVGLLVAAGLGGTAVVAVILAVLRPLPQLSGFSQTLVPVLIGLLTAETALVVLLVVLMFGLLVRLRGRLRAVLALIQSD